MKVKIDVRNNQVTDWLMDNVGTERFRFDFRTEEVEFLHDEDYVAFKLTFKDYDPDKLSYRGTYGKIDMGMFYCPYIPLLRLDDKKD